MGNKIVWIIGSSAICGLADFLFHTNKTLPQTTLLKGQKEAKWQDLRKLMPECAMELGGETPDVIIIHLGSNDIGVIGSRFTEYSTSRLGSFK